MRTLKLQPSEKQWKFLTDTHRHVAYGGARGGGKSWAVDVKAMALALKYAGIKILLVRRTLEELRKNHVGPLLEMLNGIASYKKQEKTFYFRNGSTIALGYCDNDNDVGRFQGTEYDVDRAAEPAGAAAGAGHERRGLAGAAAAGWL